MSRPSITIGAGMETAAVRIQAPAKRQVWAPVPAQNLASHIFKDFKLDMRGRSKQFSMGGFKWVGRVRNRSHERIVPPIEFSCQEREVTRYWSMVNGAQRMTRRLLTIDAFPGRC